MTHPRDARLAYASDDAEAKLLDPTSGSYVLVTVQLAEDGVYVFDRASNRRARWRYVDIVHAFDEGDDQDRILRIREDSDARLNILNDGLYNAIAARVPGLRRRWLWRLNASALRSAWDAVPDEAKTVMIIGVVLLGLALIGYGWHFVAGIIAYIR